MICVVFAIFIQTLEHLFFDCNKVRDLIADLENWLKIKINSQIITKYYFILGDPNYCILENLVYTFTKIYTQKCKHTENELIFGQLKRIIKYYYDIEKYASQTNEQKQLAFNVKWSTLFTD